MKSYDEESWMAIVDGGDADEFSCVVSDSERGEGRRRKDVLYNL